MLVNRMFMNRLKLKGKIIKFKKNSMFIKNIIFRNYKKKLLI